MTVKECNHCPQKFRTCSFSYLVRVSFKFWRAGCNQSETRVSVALRQQTGIFGQISRVRGAGSGDKLEKCLPYTKATFTLSAFILLNLSVLFIAVIVV